jgi:hypothetical protein
MKFHLVSIILSIIRSSDYSEVRTEEMQSKLTMYDEDLELRPRSPIQAVKFLIADLEEVGLDPLQEELEKLISKESRINEYKKSHEDSDDPVCLIQKIELKSSEYPWLGKLQKLLILDKEMDFFSRELQSFLDENEWLKELLSSGNINIKD